MKAMKGNGTKSVKVMRGGGAGTKTLGGKKKPMPAFGAKGVKAGPGNRF